MNWLHYLGEANLYLAVFYLVYRLLLAKETHNQFNRTYLLFSCVASFVLPVLQLGVLKHTASIEQVSPISYITVPADVAPPPVTPIATQKMVVPAVAAEYHLTWLDYLVYAYAIGCCVVFFVLMVKLCTLIRLIIKAKRVWQAKYTLIYLPESDVAFSFFNYLFIGTRTHGTDTIIRHELVHINQKHSLDILFMELLKIFNWFNPVIYLLQNSLKTVHEYIADEQTAVDETDPITYATFLVNNAYGVGGSSITHSFFNYNLLKKRIIMLNQERSGKSARLKYLITAPICVGLLCVSTLAFSKDYGFIDLDPAKISSTVREIKSAPVISHIIEKVTKPSSPNKNIKTVKADAVGMINDPAGKVTPSGYKEGYEKLTWAFIEDMRFSRGLSYYQSFATTQPHSLKDAVVVVGFTVTADQKISNVKVIKSSGTVMDNAIAGAFGNFNGTVTDKPGKHNYLVHISTHGHTEAEDDAICKKYGYENHITVAIADHTTITGDPKPTPVDTVYQNNLQKFYKDLKWYIQYPYTERENNIQGRAIVRFCVDDNGELQYLAIYRAPSIKLGYQVFWAMKHSAFLKPLKGNWALSVAFDMGGLEPETRPITEIKQDTTTRHLHSDPNGTGLKWTLGGANPAFTYDPHNMHGPYKTPVKVLSELVIKAER